MGARLGAIVALALSLGAGACKSGNSGPGSGTAGSSAGGGGGAGTSGGSAGANRGSSGASGGAGQACGQPARPLTFTRTKVTTVGLMEVSVGLMVARDQTPTFITYDGDKRRVMARHLPEKDDAGISVSIAYQLSRPHVGGYALQPVVRVARDGSLRFAYPEGFNGGWARYVEWSGNFNDAPNDQIVNPEPAGADGLTIAFDLDAQDRPGIVYALGGGPYRFATKTAAGWQVETMFSHGGDPIVLAFDGAAVPVLMSTVAVGNAATSIEGANFVASVRGATGWPALAPPDAAFPAGQALAAGRDSLGQVQAIFWGEVMSNIGPQVAIRRAVWSGKVWNVSGTGPQPVGPAVPSAAALGFGPNGEIHVVQDRTRGLLYSYFDGCTWTTQVADPALMGGTAQPTIAVDGTNTPHIAYQLEVRDQTTDTRTGWDLWYAVP